MKFPRGLSLCLLVALLSLASSALVGGLLPTRVPKNHDEFAYLLAAQTFAQGRLTNPTPPLPRFFETPHVLLSPSYLAKYPPGHGLVLALGLRLGNPLYGVWLESAFFAAAVAWLLLGIFPARWALLGGALVILQFGLTHYWAQTYWGAALAAGGGALVFGAALRIWRRPTATAAALLALGAVILMLTRPFEGLLACLLPFAVLVASWVGRDRWARRILGPSSQVLPARSAVSPPLFGQSFRQLILPFAAVACLGAVFLLYYQYRVTGSPWRAPYLVYEQQASAAPLFLWQHVGPEPAFQNDAARTYYRDYVLARSHHTAPVAEAWFSRLSSTTSDFLGTTLALAALAGLALRRGRWQLLALGGLVVVSSALALCYWFGLHYQAPAAALYVFLAVAGLRVLFLALPKGTRKFGLLAAALLAMQFGLLARAESRLHLLQQLGATTIRQRVLDTLHAAGGRHIVFVHLEKPYDPNVCWVCNDANLSTSEIVWAWDRGADENAQLLAALPDRHSVVMTIRGEKISFAEFPSAARAATP